MGEATEIAWATSTFNPWWGCTNVSPACDKCYAETLAKRWGFDIWGRTAPRRLFGEKHWNEPRSWERKAAESGQPWRVFCASMGDVFEDHERRPGLADEVQKFTLDSERLRLWRLIEETPHLTWMLLTKRPENILRMVPLDWTHDTEAPGEAGVAGFWNPSRWPRNVWVGTTVENQRYADLRIPKLLAVPAPVRFLSVEPMLGPVDLDVPGALIPLGEGRHVEWVIVGGESGAHARRMDPAWVIRLIEQCEAAEVPVFVKQAGTVLAREWGCQHRTGAKIEEWPPEFRAQEFPA